MCVVSRSYKCSQLALCMLGPKEAVEESVQRIYFPDSALCLSMRCIRIVVARLLYCLIGQYYLKNLRLCVPGTSVSYGLASQKTSPTTSTSYTSSTTPAVERELGGESKKSEQGKVTGL